jgi:suppressor for copper-sensitivity B
MRARTHVSRLAAATVLALAWLAPAWHQADAAASPWVETEQTALRLVSAAEAVGSAEAVLLGLHFRLKPGWKIYWRSPGDAGFPPRSDWAGSHNLASATIAWPMPERFSILGFETLGYTGEVVLPVRAALARAGEPLAVRARIDYLTCKEICIPYGADLGLDLPAGEATPGADAHLINRFAVRVPGDGVAHGLALERASMRQSGAATILTVSARARAPFRAPDLFVEGPEELAFGRPRVRLDDAGRMATLEVAVDGMEELPDGLVGQRLTVTLRDGERAAERTLEVKPAGAAEAAAAAPLAMVLGLALLGGLILNLMPCVLPVLSLKILGVIGHGGGETRPVRLAFLASTAGILFSFMVLAAALAGLKAAGATVGWGIQFQHPWFLVAMTVVVVLFACNLLGFFEIPLPAVLAGGAGGGGHGLGGHFLSGAFATLLATPCSAPFLGTAIGFALAGDSGDIFVVFAALGVGLALPYLLVAAAPGLATRLPRPGPWMARLRMVLGVALVATGVWLLTVLAAIAGPAAAGAVGALTAAGAAALCLRRRMDAHAGRLAWTAVGLAVAAFFMPAALPAADAPDATAGESMWQRFDEAAIPGLVAEGKTVFVDVTADWCVTCQVNKSLVLYRSPVLERLSGDTIVAMRADWTRPSDAVARYLARFGRYGIPFDAVYGPAAPEGEVLPELLSTGAVIEALDRAAAGVGATARR